MERDIRFITVGLAVCPAPGRHRRFARLAGQGSAPGRGQGSTYGEVGERNLRRLDALLRDARRTSDSVRALSEELRDDPSQLIYQPSRQGVEIPR